MIKKDFLRACPDGSRGLPVSPPGQTQLITSKTKPLSIWRGARGEVRAGNETRTRDPDLGKVVLYQLSYSRLRGLKFLRRSPESFGQVPRSRSKTPKPWNLKPETSKGTANLMVSLGIPNHARSVKCRTSFSCLNFSSLYFSEFPFGIDNDWKAAPFRILA